MRRQSIVVLVGVLTILTYACGPPAPAAAIPTPNPAVSDSTAPIIESAAESALDGGELEGHAVLPGLDAGAENAESPAPTPPRMAPTPLRGIHLSGWTAGTPTRLEPLLSWATSTGFNAVVLELKAEDGYITWPADLPLAEEIKAYKNKIPNLTDMINQLHDAGLWVIGRIVVFNDPVLYSAKADLRVPGLEGTHFRFVNPLEPQVTRYNIDIALAAAAAGIDEIQFDYIRWAERLVKGFTLDTDAAFRTGAINDFLVQALSEIKPLGVYVSADVFGLTTSVPAGDDMHIGQDYNQIADLVDWISPMVYPSHYANGTYGIPVPDREPYLTVRRSMEKALERTQHLPVSKHRPWIQDFKYPAPGFIEYGKAQVEDQIRALAELGIDSFLIWDPNNKYTRDIELSDPA